MLEDNVRLSPRVTIGPQVSEEELEQIAGEGFATIVNLCTKGECDQLLSPQEEEKTAKKLNLSYIHLPMTMHRLKMEMLDEICQTLASAPAPMYIHCRIGQRSSLVGLVYHSLYRNLTPQGANKRSKRLGIAWASPYLESLVNKYITRTRPKREELLAEAL
jgi:uncharacterized protein (TIGR01244 family)